MASPPARRLSPPSPLLSLAETRAAGEFGVSLALVPLLLRAPRGDGHPVLVLPGFLTDDKSTLFLRAYLKRLGYDAYGWKLGANLGGIAKMEARVRERVVEIASATGRTVTLLGWSLGGIYARLVALTARAHVRAVITLATPLSRDPGAARTGRLYEWISGEGPAADERDTGRFAPHRFDAIANDLGLPATAIFTKADGIVNWRTCLIPETTHAQNIEVLGASHNGLGANASALWAIADRLALAEGTYARFARRGPFALTYGRGVRAKPL